MEKEEPQTSEELQARFASAQAEAARYYDQLLRLKAEYENFRKRADRERGELVHQGRTELLLGLLPLYDVLLQAHEHIKGEQAGGSLAQGMEMIFKEFRRLFQAEGVEVIETVGRPFNPSEHEAVEVLEDPDRPEGTVAEEIQKGFKMNGRILRPARVKIVKRKSET